MGEVYGVNKLAGAWLIILAIVNVLHEFVVRTTGRGEPGFTYAVVTALFFTFGVVLLLRSVDHTKRPQRAKGPSIFRDISQSRSEVLRSYDSKAQDCTCSLYIRRFQYSIPNGICFSLAGNYQRCRSDAELVFLSYFLRYESHSKGL